jgi:5-formyltetrahydrofolate cyclo-ligase
LQEKPSPFTNAMQKKQLRKYYLNIRNTLDDATRLTQQQQVLQQLLNMPTYQQAKSIAVYLPFKGEFDPTHIIQHALQNNKQCYAPVINDHAQGHMHFEELTLENKKIVFIAGQTDLANPFNFDLMLIPLVAFDNNGFRLGMGGGFYDRYLAKYHTENKPYLLGLAFQQQFCEQLPTDSWDQQLDEVLFGC